MDNFIIDIVIGMYIYLVIDFAIYLIKTTPKKQDKKRG
jgi:hypothetical protein